MTTPRRILFLGPLIIGLFLAAWWAAKQALQLPSLEGRTSSRAVEDSGSTKLGLAASPLVQAHPGSSGIFPLQDGPEAFATRVLLADAAERSLDVQYYIWHNDISGAVLLEALRRAANRGVRVRLLLDDNNTSGLDPLLTTLNLHPTIEVRLFNPFVLRGWRLLGFLTDFQRLNRRMHNKSFTADNQATVIGGRNVGDEYFGGTREMEFVDLDVLAIGPVVHDVSDDFDRYWASESSYPLERIVVRPDNADLPLTSKAESFYQNRPAAHAYAEKIQRLPFVREMLEGRLGFEWAPTRMVSDDPRKALGLAPDSALLWTRLNQILGTPQKEIRLISPYFVPGEAGTASIVDYAESGVDIAVLTNSLEATDVLAVHAGYAKRRRRLLEAGVKLYELKRTFSALQGETSHSVPGSSNASLHAKTFAVDRSLVFVGSFNFDPRSSRLNTELGFVIDSPRLAEMMSQVFTHRLPLRAFAVQLKKDGGLQWVEQVDGEERIHDTEPHTTWARRKMVTVFSWLPIEWLL